VSAFWMVVRFHHSHSLEASPSWYLHLIFLHISMSRSRSRRLSISPYSIIFSLLYAQVTRMSHPSASFPVCLISRWRKIGLRVFSLIRLRFQRHMYLTVGETSTGTGNSRTQDRHRHRHRHRHTVYVCLCVSVCV
jgi:hypothetical protein